MLAFSHVAGRCCKVLASQIQCMLLVERRGELERAMMMMIMLFIAAQGARASVPSCSAADRTDLLKARLERHPAEAAR